MHDVEGYTHEEISGALTFQVGTSKSQLFQARSQAARRTGRFRTGVGVMTEDNFEEFLKKAAQSYNAPPARTPREDMWERDPGAARGGTAKSCTAAERRYRESSAAEIRLRGSGWVPRPRQCCCSRLVSGLGGGALHPADPARWRTVKPPSVQRRRFDRPVDRRLRPKSAAVCVDGRTLGGRSDAGCGNCRDPSGRPRRSAMARSDRGPNSGDAGSSSAYRAAASAPQ